METQIDNQTGSEILNVALEESEKLIARQNSVVSMTGGIRATSRTASKGMEKIESLMDGERLPITEITAQKDGTVMLAPPFPGVIKTVGLDTETVKVQSLSYLAASGEYDVDYASNELYSEGVVATMELTGDTNESVFISTMGGCIPIKLPDGKKTTVQADHVAAFDGTLTHSGGAGTFGGLLGKNTGGKITFTGPGTVYLHARSPVRMAEVIHLLEKYS